MYCPTEEHPLWVLFWLCICLWGSFRVSRKGICMLGNTLSHEAVRRISDFVNNRRGEKWEGQNELVFLEIMGYNDIKSKFGKS